MSTYNLLRRQYMNQLEKEIEFMIEENDINLNDVDDYRVEELQKWEDGYGDYLYDIMRENNV